MRALGIFFRLEMSLKNHYGEMCYEEDVSVFVRLLNEDMRKARTICAI